MAEYMHTYFSFVASGDEADYSSVATLISFPPSPTLSLQVVTVSVVVNGDSNVEADENFTCRLSYLGPDTIVLQPASTNITILNDDGKGHNN